MQITRFASPLGACTDDIDVRMRDASGIALLNMGRTQAAAGSRFDDADEPRHVLRVQVAGNLS